MWRAGSLSIIMLMLCQLSLAQNINDQDAILALTGVSAVEELDENELERLEGYLRHPIPINVLSVSRLKETGLFTHYQTASFDDYRSRHGDVLSFTELAGIEGFGSDFVRKISPFVSLRSMAPVGRSHGNKSFWNHDLTVRGGLKYKSSEADKDNASCNYKYGLKYRLVNGNGFSFGLSASRTYDAGHLMSGHLSWRFRRREGQVVVGDFNARFGQGLVLWNGMYMATLSSPSAFLRRSSGLSASSSFTGNSSFRGIACDVYFGRMRLSSMIASDAEDNYFSVKPAVNISYFLRRGHISVTHFTDFKSQIYDLRIPAMKTSADVGLCIRGMDIFCETAYDWVATSLSGVAGTIFRINDDLRMASMLRYFPGEYSTAISGELSAGKWVKVNGMEGFGATIRRCSGTFLCDAAYYPGHDVPSPDFQVKISTDWMFMASSAFKMKIRVSERFRSEGNTFRTEIRTDFSYLSRYFNVNVRLDAVRCSGTGILGYAEGGYKTERFSSYVRGGIFLVDDWDDRIYVYERDAPGSFNVPAFYGRGYWIAFYAKMSLMKSMKLYIRAGLTEYPFMKQFKPGKAELKLQMTLDF